MSNTRKILSARVSSPTAGFSIGGHAERLAHPPVIVGTRGDMDSTSGGGRQFLVHATLHALNAYEDLGVLLDDPDFVFEVMALKERLGLPTHRT